MAPPGPNRMPDTEWSRLLELADRNDPRYAERLARLLERYWRPLYAYARTLRPMSAEDAEDLTQEFFAMLLTRGDLNKVLPERGSFRAFLKTALRNFAISDVRKAQAQIRAPQRLAVPFAEVAADWREQPGATPEEAFDREWARALLAEAQARVRDELIRDGKGIYYQLFEEYCLDPRGDLTYDALAERHGLKAGDVRNYLHRVRVRGRETLRELVREYLLPGESVDDEVKALLAEPE